MSDEPIFRRPAPLASLTCSFCEKFEQLIWRDDVNNKMIENNACFSCNFWIELSEEKRPNAFILMPEWDHMMMVDFDTGPFKGFGGAEWVLKFEDGTIKRHNNIWHQGEVPEHMRERFARVPKATQVPYEERAKL